jgi:signal peptidase II
MTRKWKLLLGIAPVVIALDQWTKIEILKHFTLGESLPLIPNFFEFTYVRNTGAAFGFLADAHPEFRVPFFILVPLIALGAIGYLFRALPGQSRLLATALSLVVGGAIGNLIDRVRLGFVVDFLSFHYKSMYYFPAFNVADSAICIGVGILMLDLLLQKETEETKSS